MEAGVEHWRMNLQAPQTSAHTSVHTSPVNQVDDGMDMSETARTKHHDCNSHTPVHPSSVNQAADGMNMIEPTARTKTS